MKDIDASDVSIVSNWTTMRMVKEVSPDINKSFTKEINFNNALKRDNPVDELTQDAFVSYSTPAVSSETFVFDDITGCSIRDDSNGVLQVVTVTDTDINVLNQNVGTVDYESGKVSIEGLLITKYTGGFTSGSIKIFARPKNTDIDGRREDILRIRDEDTIITVEELRL